MKVGVPAYYYDTELEAFVCKENPFINQEYPYFMEAIAPLIRDFIKIWLKSDDEDQLVKFIEVGNGNITNQFPGENEILLRIWDKEPE